MVLIPSLIDPTLTRSEMVNLFAPPNPKRRYGVVALTPSFKGSGDWRSYGATVADKDSVGSSVHELATGNYEKTLVLVNRYDGIDLPDSTCRILVFDSRPYSESLVDLYHQSCRPNSDATLMRTVRTVEQGFGRSVRGEKDYSVIVLAGADLTRLVRDRNSRNFLSSQMDTQIGIGLEIAEMAKEEIEAGTNPWEAFNNLVNQCLSRDEDWKAFYVDRMAAVGPSGPNERVLNVYGSELDAESLFNNGDYEAAVAALQKVLDDNLVDERDRGWYLQEIARYYYRARRTESQRLQKQAYLNSRLLLRPPAGITVKQLTIVSEGRMERIANWVAGYDNYEQLIVAVNDILTSLAFAVAADKFEEALNEISEALGFAGERPDKEWKEGPDNLWAVGDNRYILWECKNEVKTTRASINKRETEQMNRSCAWFSKHYKGCTSYNLMVIPTRKLESAASFLHPVEIMRKAELEQFVRQVRQFFQSMETMNLKDLSITQLQSLVDSHKLSVDALTKDYGKVPKDS